MRGPAARRTVFHTKTRFHLPRVGSFMVNIEITSTRTANRPEIRDTVADTPIIEAYRRVRTQKSDIVTTHSDQRDATMDATVNHVNGVASRGPVACRSCCHARARDRRQRALCPAPRVPRHGPCRVPGTRAAHARARAWTAASGLETRRQSTPTLRHTHTTVRWRGAYGIWSHPVPRPHRRGTRVTSESTVQRYALIGAPASRLH